MHRTTLVAALALAFGALGCGQGSGAAHALAQPVEAQPPSQPKPAPLPSQATPPKPKPARSSPADEPLTDEERRFVGRWELDAEASRRRIDEAIARAPEQDKKWMQIQSDAERERTEPFVVELMDNRRAALPRFRGYWALRDGVITFAALQAVSTVMRPEGDTLVFEGRRTLPLVFKRVAVATLKPEALIGAWSLDDDATRRAVQDYITAMRAKTPPDEAEAARMEGLLAKGLPTLSVTFETGGRAELRTAGQTQRAEWRIEADHVTIKPADTDQAHRAVVDGVMDGEHLCLEHPALWPVRVCLRRVP